MHGIEDVDQCEVRETGERNVIGKECKWFMLRRREWLIGKMEYREKWIKKDDYEHSLVGEPT